MWAGKTSGVVLERKGEATAHSGVGMRSGGTAGVVLVRKSEVYASRCRLVSGIITG